jgi:serine/threonine-protein kinase
VYALGCVFFEMLAGRPPFLAETNLELLGAHLRAPIPRLCDALPDAEIAPGVQALIERAMAKKQTERFPNARAMLDALERIPQPALTSKRPLPPDTRLTLPSERAPAKRNHKALAPLLVGVVLVIAIAAFALLH